MRKNYIRKFQSWDLASVDLNPYHRIVWLCLSCKRCKISSNKIKTTPLTKHLGRKKKTKKPYCIIQVSKTSLRSLGLCHMHIMDLMGRLIWENWFLTFLDRRLMMILLSTNAAISWHNKWCAFEFNLLFGLQFER